VNGVVTGGLFPRGGGRLFSARRAGPAKCKQSHSRLTVSVCRGMACSQPMRSPQSMTTGNLSSPVSELAGIMTARISRMLSDSIRKGK
jgi:hypothetical protein